MDDKRAMAADGAAIAALIAEFYEAHPYPPPVDDLEAYRHSWDDRRRRADSHLFWPVENYRDDRSILVAGCGTSQAAHYALRWPNARVVGIDVSASSVEFTRELKRKHALNNLEVHQLAVERAGDLGQTFEYVVCTGVLHHLADPDVGLRALHDVLAQNGAMHLMVYAPFGRAGIYMLQEYCRRLGIGWSESEIDDLMASLKALPRDHPIAALLEKSRDFSSKAGVADALLHPRDRSYSVPEFMDFLGRADLVFGRWLRQAAYLPSCGAPAASPHRARLVALPPEEQYAALELFRGTMVRHSAVVYGNADVAHEHAVQFDNDAWWEYVPIRLPGTIAVREHLPPGTSAVLINRNHTDTDLYLPIDAAQERLFEGIDGRRRISEIGRASIDPARARDFFEKLWRWDQIVFDTSPAIAGQRSY